MSFFFGTPCRLKVRGLYNSATVETFQLNFIKRVVNVKQSNSTCIWYMQRQDSTLLSFDLQVNMVNQWVIIVCSDQRKLIWKAYNNTVNAKKPAKNGHLIKKKFALQHRLWICNVVTIS